MDTDPSALSLPETAAPLNRRKAAQRRGREVRAVPHDPARQQPAQPRTRSLKNGPCMRGRGSVGRSRSPAWERQGGSGGRAHENTECPSVTQGLSRTRRSALCSWAADCCPLVLSCAGRRRLHEASPGCLAPCPLLSVLSRPLAQLLAENALSHALPRAVRATLT